MIQASECLTYCAATLQEASNTIDSFDPFNIFQANRLSADPALFHHLRVPRRLAWPLALERDAVLRINCEAVMWKITNSRLHAGGVLIMAAMNLLTSADTVATRETGVAEMKRRSQMDLNSIKRTILAAVGVLALSSVNAVDRKSDQKLAFRARGSSQRRRRKWDSATRDRHGGFMVGYRYNFNRWLAGRGELRI